MERMRDAKAVRSISFVDLSKSVASLALRSFQTAAKSKIPVATALWPWLAGDVANRDVYDVLFRLVIWISLLWSWDYLKRANRAASDAMQQDIDSPRIPDVTRFRTRVANWFRRIFKWIPNRQGEKAYGLG